MVSRKHHKLHSCCDESYEWFVSHQSVMRVVIINPVLLVYYRLSFKYISHIFISVNSNNRRRNQFKKIASFYMAFFSVKPLSSAMNKYEYTILLSLIYIMFYCFGYCRRQRTCCHAYNFQSQSINFAGQAQQLSEEV